ncbi:MAG: hypothetical protein WAK55_01785, partial [Xanthobacteraceae bacterium]
LCAFGHSPLRYFLYRLVGAGLKEKQPRHGWQKCRRDWPLIQINVGIPLFALFLRLLRSIRRL